MEERLRINRSRGVDRTIRPIIKAEVDWSCIDERTAGEIKVGESDRSDRLDLEAALVEPVSQGNSTVEVVKVEVIKRTEEDSDLVCDGRTKRRSYGRGERSDDGKVAMRRQGGRKYGVLDYRELKS